MPAKRKYALEGVLFDWDGTLVNSYHADTSAYLAMFKEMGIAWGVEELESNYSPNWYEVYRAAKLPRKHWDDADRAWRAHYAKHRPKLMVGARRVLARLGNDHRLGLVTSGDRDRVTRQLREFRCRAYSRHAFAAGTPCARNRILSRCVWLCGKWSCILLRASTLATRRRISRWPGAPACAPLACSVPSLLKGACAQPGPSF